MNFETNKGSIAVALGTVLDDLDPRHDRQVEVTGIQGYDNGGLIPGSGFILGKTLPRGKGERGVRISVERFCKTYGHKNGYRVATR